MTAILGAGISGLSAGYYALQNAKMIPIVMYEATNRVGGWVHSIKLPDGTIFEQGPRRIRHSGEGGKNTLELVEQLQLSDKIVPILNSDPAARCRLIYADDQLHLLPNSIKDIIKKNTLLNRSLLSVAWNDLRAPKVVQDDESIYNFAKRRLGEDVADKLISSIVVGVYAGDPHKISAKSFMTSLFEAEQEHGSIIKGLVAKALKRGKKIRVKDKAEQMKENNTEINERSDNTQNLKDRAKKEMWAIWSMREGIEQLPKSLAAYITDRGVSIKMGHKCEQLKFNKDTVELNVNGEVKEYSHIISSLPAKSLANLVQAQHPELANELRGIPTVTVGIVNLQFPKDVLPINAFGVLIPPKEERPILGVIFDSCVPQKSDTTVLTVMMGGAWFEKYFGQCSSDEHLLTVAVNQVREILHIEEDPIAFNVSILKDCIPQHIVGHMQRLTRIRNYISTHKIPLGLCGSSYQGVGVNDVILSAKQAVSDINSHIL